MCYPQHAELQSAAAWCCRKCACVCARARVYAHVCVAGGVPSEFP